MQSDSAKRNLEVFCEAMNKKVAEMGLKNTSFRSPCGNGESTAKDMIKCLIKGNTYEELSNAWGESKHLVNIEGEDPRELTVLSTIYENESNSVLMEKYRVLGGKTGTLTNYGAFNLGFIAEIPDSEDKLACVILYANEKNSLPNNRFKAARQALDAAVEKYRNPDFDLSGVEVCAECACVCLVPKNGEEPKILFEKNADTQKYPASMTKIVTSMVVLDTIKDLEEMVPISQEVVEFLKPGFRGDDFKSGDLVKVKDLLSAMMLPSSNIASYVLGAFAGSKLI